MLIQWRYHANELLRFIKKKVDTLYLRYQLLFFDLTPNPSPGGEGKRLVLVNIY